MEKFRRVNQFEKSGSIPVAVLQNGNYSWKIGLQDCLGPVYESNRISKKSVGLEDF